MSEMNEQEVVTTTTTTSNNDQVVVEKVVERTVYVENEEQVPQKKTNGLGIAAFVISIVGFVTLCCYGLGGLACIIALIMAIIALCLKGRKKGLAIAALIISIVGIVIGLVVFGSVGAGVMAPQLIKYTEKSNQSSDLQLCDTVRSALMVCIMDPDIIVNESYSIEAISDGYTHRITDIPSGKLRDEFEEIMGCSVRDVEKQLKTGTTIEFTIKNGNQVNVTYY